MSLWSHPTSVSSYSHVCLASSAYLKSWWDWFASSHNHVFHELQGIIFQGHISWKNSWSPAIVYPVQTGGKLHNIIFKSESSVNDFFVDFVPHYLHWITFRSDHLSLFGQDSICWIFWLYKAFYCPTNINAWRDQPKHDYYPLLTFRYYCDSGKWEASSMCPSREWSSLYHQWHRVSSWLARSKSWNHPLWQLGLFHADCLPVYHHTGVDGCPLLGKVFI